MSEELDMHTLLLNCGRELGVFLYAPSPDRRRFLRGHLHALGGSLVRFPGAERPLRAQGCLEVTDGRVLLLLG